MHALCQTEPKRFFDWEYAAQFTETHLTTLPGKAAHYANELCFRETLYSCAVWSGLDHDELARRLRQTGLVLFRPDALVHGKACAILDYFARVDLHPFYCEAVAIDRSIIREVWRYQLNLASLERARLLNMLFEASPSILALFESRGRTPVPCAAIMSDCKGSTDPADRRGWELRSQLASPHRVEVYVHSADEPADVVRDGGIMLGPDAFASALLRPRTTTISASVRNLARHIGASARRSSGSMGRWQMIRVLGSQHEMNAGQGKNIISQSGTDAWWSRVGLLESRERYLSERVRGADSRPSDVHSM